MNAMICVIVKTAYFTPEVVHLSMAYAGHVIKAPLAPHQG